MSSLLIAQHEQEAVDLKKEAARMSAALASPTHSRQWELEMEKILDEDFSDDDSEDETSDLVTTFLTAGWEWDRLEEMKETVQGLRVRLYQRHIAFNLIAELIKDFRRAIPPAVCDTSALPACFHQPCSTSGVPERYGDALFVRGSCTCPVR